MNKIISLLILAIVFLGNSVFSQNVGIGTTSPTNTLHVIVSPTNPNPNPVRFEGIQRYTNEDSVLVVNPSTGVVKYMPMADVLVNLPSNLLDSLILNSVINNTDTIYNNQSVRDSIITIALSNSDTLFSTQTFRDSVLGVILSNMDTIFTITRDSLLTDSTFVNALRDSINTDDQNIDSLTINGTILTTYIEDGTSASVNVSNMLDSVILSKSDTLYSIISDSLKNDTTWITQLDSLLSIYGDTIYFNDSTYTLIKDSLLNDTAWLSELQDSINTDDQNIDSVTIHGTIITTYIEDGTSASVNVSNMLDSVILSKSDTLYSIISDSLTNDTNWIKQIDSLLSIYGDTIYFNDSSYTLVRDSLLKDSLFMDSLISLLGDSIDTDIDSIVLIGNTLHIYEDGVDASTDISGILDSIRTIDSLFTPESVIFAGSAGELSEDMPNFNTFINPYGERALFINDTSLYGTDTYTILQATTDDPSWGSAFQVSDQSIRLSVMNNSVAGGESRLDLRRSRGSMGSESNLVVNNMVGRILFTGYNAGAYRQAASIDAVVKGFGATNMPLMNLNFTTLGSADASLATGNKMTLDTAGNLGVGTQAPTNRLHLTGTNDPLRLEGLQYGGTNDSILVTDANGVVKLTSASSITSTKNFVSTSTAYTVASNVDVVLADLSTSAFTVTLPNPTTSSGRVIKVKRIDDATSTFGLSFASPSGTIDGVVSPAGPFTVGYQGYEFMSDGTNWWILTRY